MVRKVITRSPSYRVGVEWIALNDNTGDDCPSRDATAADATATRNRIAGYISTLLLADLFGADPASVAFDVYRFRAKALAK